MVGEYELVAASFYARVPAGGLAIAYDHVAAAITTKGQFAGTFEPPFTAVVFQDDPRGPAVIRVRAVCRQLIRLLPQEFEDRYGFLLSLDRHAIEFARLFDEGG